MSFVDEEDIKSITEKLIRKIWKAIKTEALPKFPILSYQESLNRFGTDKPDLRNPLELRIIDAKIIKDSGLKVLSTALRENHVAKALFIPNMPFSRRQSETLQKMVQSMGLKGFYGYKKQKMNLNPCKKMDN